MPSSEQIKRIYFLYICLIYAKLANNFLVNGCGSRLPFQNNGQSWGWYFFGKSKINAEAEEKSWEKIEQLNWSTSDWIIRHNYTFELQHVVTADGYNLSLHRLPRPGHRPVLLVHGLLTSSLAWVIMGPANSLAFQLFNNYYDVWLANMRGSAWSRHHSQFTVENSDFWSYSFHEWGRYDLPAIVDHIRNESSFQQVLLIGHSQALNAVLVMCSLQPEYNERLQFVQALAPIVALKDHVKFNTEDVKKIMTFLRRKSKAQELEVLPKKYMQEKCVKSTQRKVCGILLNLIAGIGQKKGLSRLLLFGQLLQGGSLKEVQHLQQIWESGDFVAYDYGLSGNLLKYNAVIPLIYDLTKVTVPIMLYFGETDALATPAGVNHLYVHLLENVTGVYRIKADKFNHLDFFISPQIKTLLNNRLLWHLDMFLKSELKYIIE